MGITRSIRVKIWCVNMTYIHKIGLLQLRNGKAIFRVKNDEKATGRFFFKWEGAKFVDHVI